MMASLDDLRKKSQQGLIDFLFTELEILLRISEMAADTKDLDYRKRLYEKLQGGFETIRQFAPRIDAKNIRSQIDARASELERHALAQTRASRTTTGND